VLVPRVWPVTEHPYNEYVSEVIMRSILLWLVGIPIPIIILLYLFGVM
jgi:hypothetical protein